MKKVRNLYFLAFDFLIIFLAFTVAVKYINVDTIGNQGTEIGFSSFNSNIFRMVGSNDTLFQISDILGWLSLLCVGIFACLGLYQWIKRKSLWKVDYDIFVLGGFYIIILILYFLFTKISINYRPIGELEPSYPSSHTFMAITVMITAPIMIRRKIPKEKFWWRFGTQTACYLILILTVMFRFLSGVHWFTDYIGSFLLSAFMILLFLAVDQHVSFRKKENEVLVSLGLRQAPAEPIEEPKKKKKSNKEEAPTEETVPAEETNEITDTQTTEQTFDTVVDAPTSDENPS